MKKAAEVTSIIFGWGVYICLFAGGFATFGYIAALILGGGAEGVGYDLARFIQRNYFPFVVRIVSASVIIGLISMYLSGQKALTMDMDKKEADAEIKRSKQETTAT